MLDVNVTPSHWAHCKTAILKLLVTPQTANCSFESTQHSSAGHQWLVISRMKIQTLSIKFYDERDLQFSMCLKASTLGKPRQHSQILHLNFLQQFSGSLSQFQDILSLYQSKEKKIEQYAWIPCQLFPHASTVREQGSRNQASPVVSEMLQQGV